MKEEHNTCEHYHPLGVNTKGLCAAAFYGFCSLSMTFVNKTVLTSYNFQYPFFLVSCQMLFTFVLLETLRLTNCTKVDKYSLQAGWNFILPSVFYGFHSVLALSALSGMNIPMYGVIKRCAPFTIMFLGTFILRKGLPSCLVVFSIAMITIGCIVAGYGDLSFHMDAYMYGIASVVTQALYLILVQAHHNLGATETLHLNSINTLPMLLVGSFASGEFVSAVHAFSKSSISFVFMFLLVISVGCLLNYSLFLCTTVNSALTTSVVGTVKTIAQTAIGMVTFGGISINLFTVAGISVNLIGGVLYTYAKYADSRSNEISKKSEDVESGEKVANNMTHHHRLNAVKS